ncbi:assimilatory sulfite reductase [Macrolepiota fuliginosa MF-IS2]|uniref:assimilatory sulfite reductase (NADPH) n=1 Tax=Macrolepiota fuliginosa MF-IS2 TaxID=1400762 RepID=A0A9P6C4C1_9AGAR|nr:assimilatory sulfite reductase [Macrolepiota fuliginosa MF-IS2]
MASSNGSGSSTPLSSSVTLSTPPSPRLKQALESPRETFYNNPHVQASAVVEHISSQKSNSSFVYVFDVAEQVGFGTLTKAWAKLGESATVVDLQTRAGAGLGLIGRLSQGTSVDAGKKAVLTAYTTPAGLAQMTPSFAHLPPASPESRLVIQVPTVVSAGESLALSPSLTSLATAWSLLPEGLVVLLSSTAQQAVDFADLAYQLKNSHVIHLFDHYTSGREYGHAIAPTQEIATSSTVTEAVSAAGYQFFDYAGDVNAHTVVVLLNGPLALIAQAAVRSNPTGGLGVVTVNVLRPWDEEALRRVIPSSVKTVNVFDDVPNTLTQGSLYGDVFSALWTPTGPLAIHARRITPSHIHQFLNTANAFIQYISGIVPSFSVESVDVRVKAAKRLLLLSNPQSPLASLSRVVESLFTTKSIRARLLTDHDVFSKEGGITVSRLLLAPKHDIHNHLPLSLEVPLEHSVDGSADFLGILDQNLLKSHHVFDLARSNSVALVVTTWTAEELVANLPPVVAAESVKKNITIFALNAKGIATKLAGAPGPIHDALQNVIAYLGFLRLYLGSAADEPLVQKLARGVFQETFEGIPISKISCHTWAALEEVAVASPAEVAPAATLKNIETNAIVIETLDGETLVNGAKLGSWHDAAKHLLFPSIYAPNETTPSDEEYPQHPSLRPEVPDRTYLVTTTVNRRLTPLEYNRNVFHLEFNTSGTGLKYAIGEALGVHGWNDEQEVLDFCAWYGVDPNHLITIPVPGSDKLHTRTVLQALQQQVDLFGKPPKSFYTDLAAYATAPIDKYALLFIGSPEGSSTFKKLSEKDTVAFADVLRQYPSARPGIEKLCELVGDIKPRHYSIASSQAVVGDRVDLLVVTVDWVTPSGSPRYGQCTRYLAGLKIGQKVTVSIKPSVMKLPPNPKQPLIMAGLGTGAAPFRAFLQHLAWLADNGQEVGPVYYYFGSRHQSQEYLYGEEIEAWILDGIITRAGLAFSRDGSKKVYIQHKMLEDSEVLAKMLHDDEGAFYLCGPTWPVPDVYEALVNALVKYKGIDATVAGDYLENLKEEERYVLEVY